MLCIVSFIVLSILGIFSASNRQLAREALDCVLRRVTFRPCNTGFDEKVKAKILGVVITRSEGAASFLNKYFEAISWVFFILMVASTIAAVRGVYLFYATGSCNGLNDSSFCVFDPTGQNNQVSSAGAGCAVTDNPVRGLTLQNVDLSSWAVLNENAPDKLVMVGSYGCDYTRKVYPEIRELVKKYNIEFTFGDFPVKEKSDYLPKVGYCVYRTDREKYWQMNDALFATDKANLESAPYVENLLSSLGLDPAKINVCINVPETQEAVKNHLKTIQMTNFYGTPTMFVNGEPVVGPKPYRVYAIMFKGPFYWLQ
jgi:hypothetical protein